MKKWLQALFYMLLAAVLAVLFYLGFTLNHTRCETALRSVQADLQQVLDDNVTALQQEIADREARTFALFDDSAVLVRESTRLDLFLVTETRVLPAVLSPGWVDPLDEIPFAEAHVAYERGIERMRAGAAADAGDLFRTASQIFATSPEELYVKVCAHINLIEVSPELPLPVFYRLLHLLAEKQGAHLTIAQQTFFEQRLREQVPKFDRIASRSNALWALAGEIEGLAFGRPLPFRALLGDGRIVSVDGRGRCGVFRPQHLQPETIRDPVRLSTGSLPESGVAVSRPMESFPATIAWVPASAADGRRHEIMRQYRLGNLTLGVMAILTACLGIGILLATRRERELAQLKTGFVSTVSHELRTPLSLIRLHAETLYMGRVSGEKLQDYYRTILLESERLTGIVNNVLDFSRMARGRHRLHAERTNISDLVRKVADTFQFRLEKEKFELHQDIAECIYLKTDPLAFSQIAFNLIDNAIKYSGAARVIKIVLRRMDDHVVFSVKDNGLGISDHDKKQVFREFVRVDDARVRSQRGSGIGLTVTKKLVDRLGGRICVLDNQPAGSVFEVVFNDKDWDAA